MNFFYAPAITDGAHHLEGEEAFHCSRVLRNKPGDIIGILDGKGGVYQGQLTDVNPKRTSFSILDYKQHEPLPYSIHLAMAPTKNIDRIEWMVEKLVEIGVDKITFFISQNSERRKLRYDRLEKKMISALKQSKNPFLPRLNPLCKIEDLFPQADENDKFIAFVDETFSQNLVSKIKKNSSTIIFIGPEGDFTQEELIMAESCGFNRISLGKNILRTETAGLVACQAIHFINSL